MLRVEPTDIIAFPRVEPRETFVELICISNLPITYKIQTTAPEKFRVRPRMGILLPAESVTLSISLKVDQELAENMRDKFLVMALPVPPGVEPTQDITEVWKTKTSNRSDVEQHRIACIYKMVYPDEPVQSDYLSEPPLSQLQLLPQLEPQLHPLLQPQPQLQPQQQLEMSQQLQKQSLPLIPPRQQPPRHKSKSSVHIGRQVPLPLKGFDSQMSEYELGKQLRYTQYLLWFALGLMLLLGIAVAYLLKLQFSDSPSSYESEMPMNMHMNRRMGEQPRGHDYPAATARGPGHGRPCANQAGNRGNKGHFPFDGLGCFLLSSMVISGVAFVVIFYPR